MGDTPFSPFRDSKDLVFFSGKIELTPEGKILKGSITQKTRRVMGNVKEELKKAGLDFSNVVCAQIFLTDMKDYKEMNEEYVKHLVKPYPARYVVAVKELPLGAQIEIAVVASNKQ